MSTSINYSTEEQTRLKSLEILHQLKGLNVSGERRKHMAWETNKAKYVIELDDVYESGYPSKPILYRAKNFRTLVFDDNGIRKLQPLEDAIEEEVRYAVKKEVDAMRKSYEKKIKDAYQKGYDKAMEKSIRVLAEVYGKEQ